MKKRETWIHPRHALVTAAALPLLGLVVRLKYGIRIEKFAGAGSRPYLVLMNHQTGFDQFFVTLTFRRAVYFLATEDIFSMGWISSLIRYLVAPIPIKKQTLDLQAVKNCIRVAREGGTLCIAPEGHRTFHGKTVYMKPAIASLARKLGLPIALLRIEGGYGVQPRWSDVVRRGSMRCFVSRVVEPEEYRDMTNEALFDLICRELTVDEVRVTGSFRHRKNAEFLERVIYTCPWCGFSPFESRGDIIRCTTCGRQIRHTPTKELEGLDCSFPHRFVGDWYEAQNALVSAADLQALTREPLFEDTVRLSRVIPYRRKILLKKQARVRLYGDRIWLEGRDYPFGADTNVTLLGKNKLNIYTGDQVLQLRGSRRFNALKYLNFCHRYKNIQSGGQYGQFLGL